MIVGITGKKRSGKDTVAQFLVSEYGYYQYSMAGPLKKALKTLFLWDDWHIEVDKETVDPRWGISPRQAMQHIGTEWAQYALGDAFPRFKETSGTKLWANRFREVYQGEFAVKNIRDVVISDVRFPHEEEVIRDLGGKILRIHREAESSDAHASETNVDKIQADASITNDGSFEDLYELVKFAMTYFRNEQEAELVR